MKEEKRLVPNERKNLGCCVSDPLTKGIAKVIPLESRSIGKKQQHPYALELLIAIHRMQMFLTKSLDY